MDLHVPTLLVVLMGMCVLASIGLGARWLNARGDRHYLYWSIAFFLGAWGMAGLGLRGLVPDWLSIDLSNALLLGCFGLGWNGVRVFDHRRPQWLGVIILPTVWLIACQIPEIHASFGYRAMVSSLLIAVACAVLGLEIWMGGTDRLPSRRPLAALCLLHAAICLARVGVMLFHGAGGTVQITDFATGLALLEPIFILFGVTLLGLGMTQQRTERLLQRQASIDGLTGVLNRAAFMALAETQVDRVRSRGTSVTLLVFDLDRFKAINDQYGHAAGDKVLVAFADVVRHALRDTDTVGRIGGEEFAAILPGVDSERGAEIAERIRGGFARRLIEYDGARVSATVSIGLISMTGAVGDLASLMASADKALYAAKRGGRDLVRQVSTALDGSVTGLESARSLSPGA